mgnify:FL=1
MEDERRVGAGRNGFTWSERSGDMECRRGDSLGTGLTEVVSGIGAAVGLVVGKLEHCARERRLALERFLSIGRWGALGVLVGPVACATKAPHRVDRGTAPSLPWSAIRQASIWTLSMGGPVLVAQEQNPEERLGIVVDMREYEP